MPTTRDIFTSVPAQGAILRDWTHRTLTVDIENSIGETYHFEIEPGEKSDNIPTRNTVSPSDKGWKKDKSPYVKVIMPIAS
jgi:hypothetical protein